ncbi:MAG: excisionase family DNA-binding protein [Thermoanaerobaculia bacterium]
MTPTTRSLLSPRELAEAIGVSESSIKRWADDGAVRAVRTTGGHRRIPVEDAVQFIRSSGQKVCRPEILGVSDATPFAGALPAHGEEGDLLYRLLVEGSENGTRGFLVSLFLAGWTPAQIIDGPLSEAMARVGELWKLDSSAIYVEHRATDIIVQALSRIRSLIQIPSLSARPAVGGAPAGDPYIIPSLGASIVLGSLGLRATNLGPETPLETLRHALHELSPQIVWLSAGVAAEPSRLRDEIVQLADAAAGHDCSVIVGGRMAPVLALPARPNLYAGRSMAELEAFARGLVAGRVPREIAS